MSEQKTAPRRGDVRFVRPPAKLVAQRPQDRAIGEENERLKADRPYPGDSCGGL